MNLFEKRKWASSVIFVSMHFSIKFLLIPAAIFIVLISVYLFHLKSGVYRNSDTLQNRIAISLFDFNTFHFVCSDSLPCTYNVSWRCDHEHRDLYKRTVFCNKMKNSYGINVFEITLDDSSKWVIYQPKLAAWHTNDYYFTFSKNNGVTICELKIDGPDKTFILEKK